MSYQGQSPKVNRLRLQPRSSDPVNPAEGDLQYADGSARAEGLWVYKNGLWTPAGSGSAGVKNYLGTVNAVDNGGDFELGTIGNWVLGTATLDANKLPSGSPTFGSGAAAQLSTAIIGSGQLTGLYSLSYVSSAATTAGDFLASPVFTIDQSDQGRPLTISFNYKVVSGTVNMSGTSANSFGVAIYDVTNSAWIIPSGCFSMTQSSGVGEAVASFQTGVNASPLQYRLVMYNANSTSGAATLYVDDFSVSPVVVTLGVPATDWKDLTSVAAGTFIKATTTNPSYGTTTVNKARWRRVAGNLELEWDFAQSSGGSAGSGTYLIDISQLGFSIDLTQKPANTSVAAYNDINHANVGTLYFSDAGGIGIGGVAVYSATQLKAVIGFTGASVSRGFWASSFAPFSTLTGLSARISVPIAGWSSNVSMSNDTDTRIVASAYTKSTNQSVTANVTDITFDTKQFDTHAAWNGSQFVAPVTGYYVISGVSSITAAAGTAFSAYVQGTVRVLLGVFNSNGGDAATLSGTVFLNAGQTLSIRCNQTATISATNSALQIHRLSGPAVVAASETVSASYWLSANFASSTTIPVNFDSKEFDTHSAVTTSATAWKFTAPVTAFYTCTATGINNVGGYLMIYKNGAAHKTLFSFPSPSSTGYGNGAAVVKLNAGDYIDFRMSASGTITGGTQSTAGVARVEITKSGN